MKVLSLGLGVQSTAIYYMSSMGILPRLDYAIFADTGKEKMATYGYLMFLVEWMEANNGIPILVQASKNLYLDLIGKSNSSGNRFASIPAYSEGEGPDGKAGMLRRQCTNEYKISQVDDAIRDSVYQLQKHARRPVTEVWKGITMDEADRMNEAKERWKQVVYPFCGYEFHREFPKGYLRLEEGRRMIMDRKEVEAWFIAQGLPVPEKSSCTFCPYQSEHAWYRMKVNEPEDFESACLVDDAIRDSSKQGVRKPIFLHESLKPLREVSFDLEKPDLFSGECSGGCHT